MTFTAGGNHMRHVDKRGFYYVNNFKTVKYAVSQVDPSAGVKRDLNAICANYEILTIVKQVLF